ncbi:MAG: DNA topoisomerase [Acidobacteria bacterium]|nr:MAG: DNA topoisomerase [Acidobacteriota bacterium]
MAIRKPTFDKSKARATIEKGRRAKWWERKGSKSKGFFYVDHTGKKLTGAEDLERIRSLVIPPAWRHVRISPSAGSRVQAVGMDTTGRIQYLYHSKFSEKQQRKKFAKIEKFGEYLPQFRKVTNDDISLEGFPKEKVLAVMMRLINSLYIRVGTEKSARHYRTYGITTLKNAHLEIKRGGQLVFDFVGKSHIKHRKVLVDEELASVMKELKELGAARKLFHYLDENGKPRPIKPSDVNSYIKAATAPEFSSKDFRTWGGTLLAAIELAQIGKAEDPRQLKSNIVRAVKKVAEELGNTPTVARSSYIHPTILIDYEKGVTLDEFRPKKIRRIRRVETDYEPEEKALLRLLNRNGKK